jgi:hypothetical protein
MKWEPPHPDLPTSVFAKSTQDLATRCNMSYGGICCEADFYNKLRPKIPDFATHTPVYATYSRDSYNSIIILDDIAAKVDFLSYKYDVTRTMVEDQLATLAYLHGHFWGLKDPVSARLTSSWCSLGTSRTHEA